MRNLLLLPLLLLVGSCVRQVPMETVPVGTEPDQAMTDGAPLTELDYGRFQILYDCALGEPHRFTYTIGPDTGSLERIDNFRVDQSLPAGCKGQISAKAYNSVPGFDRGHLAPANHFDDSRQAMNASNLMTNIVPQIASHNRYTWGMTETLTECYREFGQVRVIGGVVFGSEPADLENDYFVETHGIATPEAFWKVLLAKDATGNTQVIAWWIPHAAGLGSNLDPYVHSVAEVEALLGPYEPRIDVPEVLKHIRPATTWPRPAGCDTE